MVKARLEWVEKQVGSEKMKITRIIITYKFGFEGKIFKAVARDVAIMKSFIRR